MSENENNSCVNAGENSVEVKENPQVNQQSSAPTNENNLVEPAAQPAACQIAPPGSNDAQQQQQAQQLETDANANTKESVEANNNDSITVTQLQDEILKRTNERDAFRRKLEETERKLSTLQASQGGIINGSINSDDSNLRRELETVKTTLNQTKLVLNDRERRVASQENQISALSKQVSSLKEVVAITKDMLNIRNMEVKHLQEDVDKMEEKITAERDRHNAMLEKMDAAVRLNADLKKEYMTQLQLFQDLRGKYEEKVILLNEENQALETAVQAQPAQ